MIYKAVIFTGYRPKKDKSISLSFCTQEVTPNDVAYIHALQDTYGYLVFKPNETLTKDEIKDLDKLDTDLYDSPKTQSQRMRSVLFLNWQQNNDGHQEFKDYYKAQTNKIIEHFKNKLQDKE